MEPMIFLDFCTVNYCFSKKNINPIIQISLTQIDLVSLLNYHHIELLILNSSH